jgi:hypothetical protein
MSISPPDPTVASMAGSADGSHRQQERHEAAVLERARAHPAMPGSGSPSRATNVTAVTEPPSSSPSTTEVKSAPFHMPAPRFFAGREVTDLDTLNAQAAAWCRDVADLRRWPDDRERSVAQAFDEERPSLLPLPDDRFACSERVEVSVGEQPYVRFDRNDYSVPHTLVRQPLTVVADLETVKVCRGCGTLAAPGSSTASCSRRSVVRLGSSRRGSWAPACVARRPGTPREPAMPSRPGPARPAWLAASVSRVSHVTTAREPFSA